MHTAQMDNVVPPEAVGTEWIEGPGKCRFYTRRWTAANPVARIVFVHGFIEHVDRYEHVFSRLAAKHSISAFAFDQRGFGRTAFANSTQGITTWARALPDIDFFLAQELDRDSSTPLFLFGHSMGGALSLAYATRMPASAHVGQLAGIVSSAPLLRQADGVRANPAVVTIGGLIGKVLPSLQINVGVPSGDICRDADVNKAYAADPLCAPIGSYAGVAAMLQGGEKLVKSDYRNWPRTLPVLVYHGTGDKVTACAASEEFVKRVDAVDKTFLPFDRFYHELHNEPGEDKERVIDAVGDWIIKRAHK